MDAMSLAPQVPVRVIDDVRALKALSDPTRLSILRALMHNAHIDPRVMSAKELSAELGQPQTKLYRHLRQLEACQLIQVAQTRIVSGIVEHRYRAGQLDLVLDSTLGAEIDGKDAGRLVATAFDDTRDGLLAAIAALPDGSASSSSHIRPLNAAYEGTLPLAKIQEFYERLQELISQLGDIPQDHTGTPIRFHAALYAPVPTRPRRAAKRPTARPTL